MQWGSSAAKGGLAAVRDAVAAAAVLWRGHSGRLRKDSKQSDIQFPYVNAERITVRVHSCQITSEQARMCGILVARQAAVAPVPPFGETPCTFEWSESRGCSPGSQHS